MNTIWPKNHLKGADIIISIRRRNMCRFKNKVSSLTTENFLLISNSDKKCLVFPLYSLPYLVCHLWRSTWWYAQWVVMSVNFDLPLQEFLSIPFWFFKGLLLPPSFFSSSCRFFNVYTTQKKSAGGLYFSGSSNEDFDSSACFPSLFSTM